MFLNVYVHLVCVGNGVFSAIEEFPRIRGGDTLNNICDGSLYQELVASGFLLNPLNISLQFNTDDVPVFKSSSFSFWPLHLIFNELPPRIRHYSIVPNAT